MHAGVKIAGASEKLDRLPASLRTPLGRESVLEKLDSSCATPLSALADSLASRSADEFASLLPAACGACGVRIHGLDKKREKQLVLQHRQAFIEMLGRESSPTDAVRLGAQLLACCKTARRPPLHTHTHTRPAPQHTHTSNKTPPLSAALSLAACVCTPAPPFPFFKNLYVLKQLMVSGATVLCDCDAQRCSTARHCG
jgi:hypothetical protein